MAEHRPMNILFQHRLLVAEILQAGTSIIWYKKWPELELFDSRLLVDQGTLFPRMNKVLMSGRELD